VRFDGARCELDHAGTTPLSNVQGHLMTTDARKPRRDPNRKVIDAYCSAHGGPRGFTPLVCTKVEDTIIIDPHATGGCVLYLDETAATALFDLLGEWLG
jgi:hypothetical protein